MAATVTKGGCFSRLFKISLHVLVILYPPLFCSEAVSANWHFGARAETSFSYIDNINLGDSANAESSGVFELTPGFSLLGEGRRLRAKADYQLQSLYYSNNPVVGGGHDSDYFHRLSASANSELLERLLFVDAGASVTQQSSSAIGAGSLDNYSVSEERGTVNKLSLSPYFHHQIGKGLSTELRYRYNELDGDKNIVNNVTVQTVALAMDSGNLANRWQWTLNAQNSEVDYQTQSDQTHLSADLGLSYHLFSRTILSLHGGTEKVEYKPSNVGSTGGDYWLVSMDWRPGKRTSIFLQAGERYYGTSYGLSFNHRLRTAEAGLDYKEDLTNRSLIQFEPFAIQSGTTENAAGELVPIYDFKNYPVLTTEVLLRKTLSGHVRWFTAKSTISLRLADTNFEYQTSDNTERTQSGEASWQWRTSQDMAFNITGYYHHRKLVPTNSTESIRQVEMKLTHTLSPNTSTSMAVASTDRNTDINTLDYSQKRLTLAINMKW